MNKKIRRFVIILGVLAIIFLACVGLGYYYILAPNTSVKDDGIPCDDTGTSKMHTPPAWLPDSNVFLHP